MNVPGSGGRRIATQSDDLCAIPVGLREQDVRGDLDGAERGVVHHNQLGSGLQCTNDGAAAGAVCLTEESRFEPVLPVDHEILVGRGDNGVREVRPLIGRLARTGKAAENDEFFHRTPKD